MFNLKKLDSINASYIRKTETKTLTQMILDDKFIKIDLKKHHLDYIQKAIQTVKQRLKNLSEVKPFTRFYFKNPEYPSQLLVWKDLPLNQIKNNLKIGEKALEELDSGRFTIKQLETELKKTIAENNIGTGDLLWPLRVALTGEKASPSPFEVAWVLGKKETIQRIKDAIAKLLKHE